MRLYPEDRDWIIWLLVFRQHRLDFTGGTDSTLGFSVSSRQLIKGDHLTVVMWCGAPGCGEPGG